MAMSPMEKTRYYEIEQNANIKIKKGHDGAPLHIPLSA
jgi:hypothetical protein